MQSIRDYLRANLGRSLEALPPLERLQAAWPVACGRTVAARGHIAAYSGTEVHILVDDRLWLDQMFSMRSTLARDLQRIAALPVTAIHFKLSH